MNPKELFTMMNFTVRFSKNALETQCKVRNPTVTEVQSATGPAF